MTVRLIHNFVTQVIVRLPYICAAGVWGLACGAWIYAPNRPGNPAIENSLTELGRALYRPEYDIPIYLVCGVIAVLTTTAAMVWNSHQQATSDATPRGIRHQKQRLQMLDVIAAVLVFAIVWVPNPKILAERCFTWDGFHHINYYLMGPLQAYRHGIPLGTSFYTQYESGWVMLFASLGALIRVDHSAAFGTFTVFAALYFISAYCVIRLNNGTAHTAFAFVLLCIYLNLFCSCTKTPWLWISSTMVRCPLDMTIACLLFFLGRDMSNVWGFGVGAFAGLSLLFGVDTGVYTIAALGVMSAAMLVGSRRKSLRATLSVLGVIWGTTTGTALVGLALASRGTLFRAEFWAGYFEALSLYPSGFSSVPMSASIANPIILALLMLVVLIYTCVLGGVFSRAILCANNPRDLGLCFLATIGFGSLLVFVNRSMTVNLFHPICPACVLWAIKLSDVDWWSKMNVSRGISNKNDQFRKTLNLSVGIFMCTVIGSVMLSDSRFRGYPSALRTLCQTHPPADENAPHLTEILNAIQDARSAVETLQKNKSFAIVGEDPTLWLVTLDLPPNGRYCPSFMATVKQERRVLDDINSETVIVTPENMYAITQIEDYVRSKYSLQHVTAHYSVYTLKHNPE